MFTLGTGTFSANENGGSVLIPVARTGGSTGAVSVILSTGDSTAVAGLDYTTVTQTLNWAGGDSSPKDITIPITDRGLTSGSKTVNLTLTYATWRGDSSVTRVPAVLTINDYG